MPSENGRKRLYLGPGEPKARAELYRYMAQYFADLDESAGDSRTALKRTGNSISLIALAVDFLRWTKANRTDATWNCYRGGLKHITRPYKHKLALELTPSDVEKVKQEMISQGYAARTINIVVGSTKRMYNWAVKQALLAENPVAGVEHVSKHVNAPDHPPERYLPLERALACIELCQESQPLGDMCELMLLTGMRVGEVVRVTWQDVDVEQRMLRLERHKTSGHTARPRTVPLCDRAVAILSKYASDDLELDGPVFRGHGNQPLTPDSLLHRLRRLQGKHPELKDFTFHKLRHTCATYLARLKVPERVAQAILGHSSTLMTRYYTATDKDEMIEAVERLSAETRANGS